MSTTVSPLFHELVAALEEIIRDAPKTEPVDPGFTGNCDDNRDYGSALAHWRVAEFARGALSKAKSGHPLITVSPSMIDAAQDEFIAQWRLGASPDGAVSAAVRAAVNHINNSIKERGNEQA